MKFADIASWVEAHPGESILIGGAGAIGILWLLGYFSSGSSADSGASNLASAYYAAEAQQAVVGGQIQIATLQTAAQTAQTKIQADAATAINLAQAGAATTINGQNTGRDMTVNQAQVTGAVQLGQIQSTTALGLGQLQSTTQLGLGADQTQLGLGVAADQTQLGVAQSSDQLQATLSNNSTALATVLSNNDTAIKVNAANNATTQYGTFVNATLPGEFARMGMDAFTVSGGPGGASLNISGLPPPPGTPAWFNWAGYSPGGAASLATPPDIGSPSYIPGFGGAATPEVGFGGVPNAGFVGIIGGGDRGSGN